MSKGTTIQINSLEALERLIGGDEETLIDIRNSVVQEFTKKHLKSLLTDEMVDSIKKSILDELKGDYFVKYSNNHYYLDELRPGIAAAIKNEVKPLIREEIEKLVKESLNVEKISNDLNFAIKEAVNKIESSITDRQLNNRLDKLVDERLRNKLGIRI